MKRIILNHYISLSESATIEDITLDFFAPNTESGTHVVFNLVKSDGSGSITVERGNVYFHFF